MIATEAYLFGCSLVITSHRGDAFDTSRYYGSLEIQSAILETGTFGKWSEALGGKEY